MGPIEAVKNKPSKQKIVIILKKVKRKVSISTGQEGTLIGISVYTSTTRKTEEWQSFSNSEIFL